MAARGRSLEEDAAIADVQDLPVAGGAGRKEKEKSAARATALAADAKGEGGITGKKSRYPLRNPRTGGAWSLRRRRRK